MGTVVVGGGDPSEPDPEAAAGPRLVAADDPVVVAATTAVQTGDLATLDGVLAAHPWLARARLGDPECYRTLLHAATDWPGHFPHGMAVIERLVRAGADISAPSLFPGHRETPLHWAASSNDVDVLDALLDAGADIEAPGAVLGGGTALADACGFGNWQAARRLVERGATTRPKDAAALGLLECLAAAFSGPAAAPDRGEVTRALWSACHGGQRSAAAYLYDRGGDVSWVGWDQLTPLDVAEQGDDQQLTAWLRGLGARNARELA
ncbi:MAG: ankyrin repeat domain-containing protein [Acidimicrobiales bacterium]